MPAAFCFGVFERSMPSDLIRRWTDSIRTEKALAIDMRAETSELTVSVRELFAPSIDAQLHQFLVKAHSALQFNLRI
jgi:hypothetical protein